MCGRDPKSPWCLFPLGLVCLAGAKEISRWLLLLPTLFCSALCSALEMSPLLGSRQRRQSTWRYPVASHSRWLLPALSSTSLSYPVSPARLRPPPPSQTGYVPATSSISPSPRPRPPRGLRFALAAARRSLTANRTRSRPRLRSLFSPSAPPLTSTSTKVDARPSPRAHRIPSTFSQVCIHAIMA